jgi:hypothetical protein
MLARTGNMVSRMGGKEKVPTRALMPGEAKEVYDLVIREVPIHGLVCIV